MQDSELDWSLVAYTHVQQRESKSALDAFFTAHTVCRVHACACACMPEMHEHPERDADSTSSAAWNHSIAVTCLANKAHYISTLCANLTVLVQYT